MISAVLHATWDEQLTRLRLGVAAVGVQDPRRALAQVGVYYERVPRPWRIPPAVGRPDSSIGLPALRRTASGRFVDVFGAPPEPSGDRVVVRLVDHSGSHVPRRLSIPVPRLATVLGDDQAHDADSNKPLTPRACWPVLFPSVAGGTLSGTTLLYGRARYRADGAPAAWARVEAWPAGANPPSPVWFAHADQNGEFVLVVGAVSLALTMQPKRTIDIAVRVWADAQPGPAVDSPTGTRADPLWALPVESVRSLDRADAVTLGTKIPARYRRRVTKTVAPVRGAANPSTEFFLS